MNTPSWIIAQRFPGLDVKVIHGRGKLILSSGDYIVAKRWNPKEATPENEARLLQEACDDLALLLKQIHTHTHTNHNHGNVTG